MQTKEGRLIINKVYRDGPAFSAGIMPGDELIGIEGFRVDEKIFKNMMENSSPNEQWRLTISRYGKIKEIIVVLAKRPLEKIELLPLDTPTIEQKQLFEAWTNIKYEQFLKITKKIETDEKVINL